MHHSSLECMKKFINDHLSGKSGKVADIGSLDVNGSYRDLFGENWKYTGVDTFGGKNVDIHLSNQYDWKEIKSSSFDVVVSGQTLEHVEHDGLFVKEIYRILKQGGLCCVIAPSTGPNHATNFYVDYRRYSKDALTGLMKTAGFTIIEAYTNEIPSWCDTVVIAKKGKVDKFVIREDIE